MELEEEIRRKYIPSESELTSKIVNSFMTSPERAQLPEEVRSL